MNAKDTLKKIKTMLGVQIALEQMKLDNGTVIEAEVFEAGYDVFIVSDEEKIALPVGEYTLEDGKIIIVEVEGVIREIKEAEAEAEEEAEAPAEEVAPEAATEPEMQAEPTAPKKVIESISKEIFFAEIEKLRNEIAELKLSKEEEVKEVELSEESKPIVHNPEVKAEKEINLYATKRVMTTKDRVFNKLFNN
jgi:hypothetical protein